MHRGDRETVTRDADEPHETLVARLDCRLDRAAVPQRRLPLDDVNEVVQLDQVDVVDAEPVERAPDALLRALVVAVVRLCRDEEPAWLAPHPRCDAQLGVAVRGRSIDVVDSVSEQQVERALGVRMRDVAERSRAEDRAAALVAGDAERRGRDHVPTLSADSYSPPSP